MSGKNLLKPVSTVELALSILGFLKTASVVFALTLVEFARMKQKMAEDKQAVAETELKSNNEKAKIDEENAGKSPDDIIDEFLNKPS